MNSSSSFEWKKQALNRRMLISFHAVLSLVLEQPLLYKIPQQHRKINLVNISLKCSLGSSECLYPSVTLPTIFPVVNFYMRNRVQGEYQNLSEGSGEFGQFSPLSFPAIPPYYSTPAKVSNISYPQLVGSPNAKTRLTIKRSTIM